MSVLHTYIFTSEHILFTSHSSHLNYLIIKFVLRRSEIIANELVKFKLAIKIMKSTKLTDEEAKFYTEYFL